MTNKEKELKRLHDIVFEGAPSKFMYAAQDWSGSWFIYRAIPKLEIKDSMWIHSELVPSMWFKPCLRVKARPKTTLNWTDTLIKRGDYE